MHRNFLKYSTVYNVKGYSLNEYIEKAKSILKNYQRIEWLKILTSFANKIFLGNDLSRYRELHKELCGNSQIIVIHRRANLLVAQLLFSINESQFSLQSEVKNQDIIDLYLIINECLDYSEVEVMKGTSDENLLFSTFKIISTSFCSSDLKVSLNLFTKYYDKISSDPNSKILKPILQDELCVDLDTIIKYLKSFQDTKSSIKPLSFLDKLIVLNYNEIDEKWLIRDPCLPVPYEYNFVAMFPMIKHEGNYYVFDVYSLFNSIITRIYTILFSLDSFDFKDYFGKKIVEPVILKRLSDHFICRTIKELKVQTRKHEYADFGIIQNRDIFLFELKSAFFTPEIRYTRNWDYFFKSFNGKYVTNSGIEQQLKHIVEIDTQITKFCNLNSLPVTKYKIHPILVGFDESLQCYGCNSHLNAYYKKRIDTILPSLNNIEISTEFCLLTINEIELLAMKFEESQDRLDLIRSYILTPDKVIPFREFIELHE
jgi:hypothetical protein